MPDARVPLTARGWQQAICAGDSLRREMDALEGGRPYKLFFYTSPYLRSRQVGFLFYFYYYYFCFSSAWVAWCAATPVEAVAVVASDHLPPILSSRRHTRAWCRRLTRSSSRGCRRRCNCGNRSVVSCRMQGASWGWGCVFYGSTCVATSGCCPNSLPNVVSLLFVTQDFGNWQASAALDFIVAAWPVSALATVAAAAHAAADCGWSPCASTQQPAFFGCALVGQQLPAAWALPPNCRRATAAPRPLTTTTTRPPPTPRSHRPAPRSPCCRMLRERSGRRRSGCASDASSTASQTARAAPTCTTG
jgi:hypothetical protein